MFDLASDSLSIHLERMTVTLHYSEFQQLAAAEADNLEQR